METRETSETSSLTIDASHTHHETPTHSASLTYAGRMPTFRRMSSAAASTDVETLTLSGIPAPLKAWLQEKALRRIQADGGRFAVSPIIVEILERARAEEEGR